MSDPFGIPGFSPHLAQHMDFTRQLAEHIARIDATVARIEADLRANQMHEGGCASLQPVWLTEPAQVIPRPPCDCWLTDPPTEPA